LKELAVIIKINVWIMIKYMSYAEREIENNRNYSKNKHNPPIWKLWLTAAHQLLIILKAHLANMVNGWKRRCLGILIIIIYLRNRNDIKMDKCIKKSVVIWTLINRKLSIE
jgi:prophage maintenance system killer protein